MRQTYLDVVGPVGGVRLELRDFDGATIAEFRENFAPDIDPTPGKVELKLAEGAYSLCAMDAPLGYWFVGIQPGDCFWFTVKRDSIAELPPITSYPFHSVYWGVTDGVAGPDFNLNPIGPSTFVVEELITMKKITVVDKKGTINPR